jgi:hypothetical protein
MDGPYKPSFLLANTLKICCSAWRWTVADRLLGQGPISCTHGDSLVKDAGAIIAVEMEQQVSRVSWDICRAYWTIRCTAWGWYGFFTGADGADDVPYGTYAPYGAGCHAYSRRPTWAREDVSSCDDVSSCGDEGGDYACREHLRGVSSTLQSLTTAKGSCSGVSLKAALKSAGLIVLALDDVATCGMVRLLSRLLDCLCWRWIVKIQPMAW